MAQILIKKLTPEMLADVAELERECFAEPWSEKSLELLTAQRGVGFGAVCPDGRVVAYGGMLTVLDEGQITNVATSALFRRHGLAREIMAALEGYARENAISVLTLEVRASNEAARALYSSLGWSVTGTRKNFYRLPREDAILMEKKL